MLPAHVKVLIGRLDAGSLTAFVGGLLSAEAGRLRLSPGDLIMSDAIDEADGGLDALARGVPAESPDGAPPMMPEGLAGFQVKSTQRKQPGAFDLPHELRKPGPKRVLLESGTYVLVTGQDLNPKQRGDLEAALRSEASKVLAEQGAGASPARTAVWDAQSLASVASVHAGPAVDIGLDEFGDALTLAELLESLRADERPFQSDPARDEAIERVRRRAAEASADPLLLMVHGDAGAGKTRTVAHALDVDGLRDDVLYVNGEEGLRLLTTRMIRNRTSRGILFVDEATDTEVMTAAQRLGGLGGRWRVISVQTRADGGWISQGGRNIVLPPLDGDATRRLVELVGLPAAAARMVADVAEGFPGLALRLADELKAEPGLDLVRLARLPSSTELLRRAIRDAAVRRHLAPIALFAAVGFDDELSYELDSVATGFGLDAAAIRRTCDEELQRGFVSRAGRYRMVSPKLIAIWLASELIEATPRIDEVILGLPESLRDAFVRQIEFLGPSSPHLPAALGAVIADERFRRPEAFSEAAARFLRASAAIVPGQVARDIEALLGTASADELDTLPRRDLVWALQVLLWWPETWDSAAASLLRLALHETEGWANNATNSFVGAFTVYLGGTLVPFAHRAGWLRDAIEAAPAEGLPVLARAAAAGLQVHHARTVVGFRGGGEPTDWRPATAEEHITARRAAWDNLVLAWDRSDGQARGDVARLISQSLRTAHGDLGEPVLRDISGRSWSVDERAELAASLRLLIAFDAQEGASRDALLELHDELVGRDLAGRLDVILRSRPWDLSQERDREDGVPLLLRELADDVAVAGGAGLALALSAGARDGPQEGRYILLRELARRLGARRIGEAAAECSDWTGLTAALSVADETGEGAWATETLAGLASSEPERVPSALVYVDLQPQRVDLTLSLVEAGTSPAGGLGQLLYGARIRQLDEPRAVRLLQAMLGARQVEACLGMLDQWLEGNPASAPVTELARRAARAAVASGRSPMLDFYLVRLVRTVDFSPQDLLALLEALVLDHVGGGDELAGELLGRLFEAPGAAAGDLLQLVRRAGSAGAIGASDLTILSRLAAASSVETVWGPLSGWPDLDLRWALHHMDWRGEAPDPLVQTFLTSERLAGLEDEAYVCFVNTLGVVMGPFHAAVEREVARAMSWQRALAGGPGESWSQRLVAEEAANVDWHRRREAEDDALLGR
jgi:hypothetical protein